VSDDLYDPIAPRIGNAILIETSDGRALDGRDLLAGSGRFANVPAAAAVKAGVCVAKQPASPTYG
jgi:hypothetical protein